METEDKREHEWRTENRRECTGMAWHGSYITHTNVHMCPYFTVTVMVRPGNLKYRHSIIEDLTSVHTPSLLNMVTFCDKSLTHLWQKCDKSVTHHADESYHNISQLWTPVNTPLPSPPPSPKPSPFMQLENIPESSGTQEDKNQPTDFLKAIKRAF